MGMEDSAVKVKVVGGCNQGGGGGTGYCGLRFEVPQLTGDNENAVLLVCGGVPNVLGVDSAF